MPRFSKEERSVLIEIAETFSSTTADQRIRSRLNSAIRKLRQSDDHHTKREQEQRKS